MRKWIVDWNLTTEKKHTLLRLVYEALVDCKKRYGGRLGELFQKGPLLGVGLVFWLRGSHLSVSAASSLTVNLQRR